jgi:transposase
LLTQCTYGFEVHRFTASDHGLMAVGRDGPWHHRRCIRLKARAARLYRESDPKPTIRKLAEQLNVDHEALRNWIRQDQADRGECADQPTTEMVEENRQLRKEVADLRRVNEILRVGLQLFRLGARPDLATFMRLSKTYDIWTASGCPQGSYGVKRARHTAVPAWWRRAVRRRGGTGSA